MRIRQPAVVEDLEEDVEHIRMGLLDLVEEDHLVRPPPDGLGELTALFVADVAGWRADQPRDGELLHVLAHVDADHRLLVVEQEFGEGPGKLGLADAGRAEEQERADRAARILEAGTRSPNGVGDRLDGLVLADHPLVESLLHADELGHLAFEQPRHRNARPLRDDLGDVVGRDLFLEQRARTLEGGHRRFLLGEALGQLALGAVFQLGGALVVRLALGLLDLDLERLQLRLRGADGLDGRLLGLPALLHGAGFLADLAELLLERLEAGLRGVVGLLAERLALDLEQDPASLELVELDRHRVDLHPEARCRLVHEVDRLVGQESLGDVAVREGRGRDERRVRDPDAVVDLVALAEPAQDRDRLLDARLVDDDRLEAALERGVLLDVLAVLVEGRRPDRVELAAGQHRLEQVRGVHRALGRAGTDDGVQLVDEEDDRAAGVLDLLEDGLQALLELASELRAGNEGAEIERDDPLVLECLGNVAADDPLGEAFGDRRLADAGLADQHRVVLRPAREDLHHATDLVVATDDGVELAGARLGGEVAAVLVEGLVGALGVLGGHALAAPD